MNSTPTDSTSRPQRPISVLFRFAFFFLIFSFSSASFSSIAASRCESLFLPSEESSLNSNPISDGIVVRDSEYAQTYQIRFEAFKTAAQKIIGWLKYKERKQGNRDYFIREIPFESADAHFDWWLSSEGERSDSARYFEVFNWIDGYLKTQKDRDKILEVLSRPLNSYQNWENFEEGHSDELLQDIKRLEKLTHSERALDGFDYWIDRYFRTNRELNVTSYPDEIKVSHLFHYLKGRYRFERLEPRIWLKAVRGLKKKARTVTVITGAIFMGAMITGPGGDIVKALFEPGQKPVVQGLKRLSYEHFPFQREIIMLSNWMTGGTKSEEIKPVEAIKFKELLPDYNFDENGDLTPKFVAKVLESVKLDYASIYIANQNFLEDLFKEGRAFQLKGVSYQTDISTAISSIEANMKLLEDRITQYETYHDIFHRDIYTQEELDSFQAEIAANRSEIAAYLFLWQFSVLLHPDLASSGNPFLDIQHASQNLGYYRLFHKYESDIRALLSVYKVDMGQILTNAIGVQP